MKLISAISNMKGLYADEHGVLANDLYDLQLKKYIKYSYELFHYSNNTVPIWVSLFNNCLSFFYWNNDFSYSLDCQ